MGLSKDNLDSNKNRRYKELVLGNYYGY